MPQPGAPVFRFAQLPFYAADAAGLCAAYGALTPAPPPLPYRRDGLLLLHRGATYVPGRSPLALSWRDAACSAWSIDGDDDGGDGDDVTPGGQSAQRVLLRLLDAPPGALGTADEPPAVLCAVPGWCGEPPAGGLLRCELPAGGLHLDAEGRLCGAQLRVLGLAAGRRAEADTANRVRPACPPVAGTERAALTRCARGPIAPQIMAQHAARHAPLLFQALLAAAAAPPGDDALCGGADAAAADMDAA